MARVRGNFKSLLSRLPAAVAVEFREQLDKTGKMLLARARSRVPVYQGRRRRGRTPGTLKQALSYKVLSKSLKLKVGVVGKAANRRAYYAAWVEFGHRIGTKRTGRLRKLAPARGNGKEARLARARRRRRVRRFGVRPRPFLYTASKQEIYAPYQKLWGRALQRAATGATSE